MKSHYRTRRSLRMQRSAPPSPASNRASWSSVCVDVPAAGSEGVGDADAESTLAGGAVVDGAASVAVVVVGATVVVVDVVPAVTVIVTVAEPDARPHLSCNT